MFAKTIESEETEAYEKFRWQRMVDTMRAVAQTPDGERLVGFLMLEVSGLMLVGVNEGRREVGSVIYKLLDEAETGLAERVALAARKQLAEDNLNIADAIRKRSEDDAS